MDKKERESMRQRIGEDIDLKGSRLKDSEVESLFGLVTSIGDNLGRTKTMSDTYTGFSSDGKFTRTETDIYTISRDEKGFFIGHHHENHDHDGDGLNSVYDERIDRARDVIRVLGDVFDM